MNKLKRTYKVQACIHDDKQFKSEIRKHVKTARQSQYEIGKLTYYYIKEHGQKYGKDVFAHIAELAELSIRSIHYYHDYYRLKAEYGDCANLHNLGISHHYEVARLLKYPNPEVTVPEAVNLAYEKQLSVSDTSKLVTEIIAMQKKKKRKVKPDPEPNPPPANHNEFSIDKQERLIDSATILREIAKEDNKLPATINMSKHLNVISGLSSALLAYMAKLVEQGEGYSIELDIRKIASESAKLLDEIKKQINKAS